MSALILAVAAIAAADAVPDAGASPSILLGRSFGKEVYLEDVISPRAIPYLLRREGADRLMVFAAREFAARLRNDLIAAYAEAHKLKATDAELKRCKAGLTRPGAPAPTDEEARKRLIGWNVNHALFEQEHGRLMANVDGAQAVDAQRKLLERYEAAKQISFASPKVRDEVLASLEGGYDLTRDEAELRAFLSGPKCLRAAPP